MFKFEIHRATLTRGNLHYVGALTLDSDFMGPAAHLPSEQESGHRRRPGGMRTRSNP
jgi:aspartate 1-decarboxylase